MLDGKKNLNISQSQIIKSGKGSIKGIVVNSHTSGTLKVIDGEDNGASASAVLTSAGACVPASHGQNILTSTGASVPASHAVSVFTSNGVVVDGQTITIGTKVYRAKTVPMQVNDVNRGADAEAFLANLYATINGTHTPTQAYEGTVAHTQVVAVAKDATTLTIRGRVVGTSLNAVATTETFTNGSWADTTLGGGTGASDAGVTSDNALVVIGALTYTIVDELSETYGADAVAYQVKKGVSEATMLDNLKSAVNGTTGEGTVYSTGTEAHPYIIATTNTDTAQTITARTVGDDAYTAIINALATTETLANTAWADTTYGGGTGNSNPAVTTEEALITLGDNTYTAVIELSETSGATAVPYQVLWVTSEAVFLDNIKLAVNETGTHGTQYSTGTETHPHILATTNTDTEQTFVSKEIGTVGNALASTETLGNYSFAGLLFTGGTGTSGRVMFNTITLPATSALTTFDRFISLGNAEFYTALLVVIGGTADITVVYDN